MGLIKRFETSYSKACQNSFCILLGFNQASNFIVATRMGSYFFFYYICPEFTRFASRFLKLGTRILTYVLISTMKTVV